MLEGGSKMETIVLANGRKVFKLPEGPYPFVTVRQDGLQKYRMVKLIAEDSNGYLIEPAGQNAAAEKRNWIFLPRNKGWTIEKQ